MTRFRVRSGVLRAHLTHEEVLLNPDTGIYHLANVSGSAVLAALDAGDTVEQCTRRLAEATGTPEERVRADVNGFVQAMLNRGVLEKVDQ